MKKSGMLNIMTFMVSFLLFGSIMMILLMSNVDVKVTEIKQPPIYKSVDKVVETYVYHQETPIIPIKSQPGKELILIDKSGSMEEFVTSLYKNNIDFFTQNDIWAFDTDVYKNAILDEIEFSGDTNICGAINMAIESGYSTIWLCSDMEHNTGDIKIENITNDIQIIIYSPKILDEQKTASIMEILKDTNTKVITIN